MLFVTNVSAVIALGAIMLVQGKFKTLPKMPRRDVLFSMGLGLVNPFIYYLILFAAYDRLPAQVAQPINFTWALVLAFLSVPLLGHKMTWKEGVYPRSRIDGLIHKK